MCKNLYSCRVVRNHLKAIKLLQKVGSSPYCWHLQKRSKQLRANLMPEQVRIFSELLHPTIVWLVLHPSSHPEKLCPIYFELFQMELWLTCPFHYIQQIELFQSLFETLKFLCPMHHTQINTCFCNTLPKIELSIVQGRSGLQLGQSEDHYFHHQFLLHYLNHIERHKR